MPPKPERKWGRRSVVTSTKFPPRNSQTFKHRQEKQNLFNLLKQNKEEDITKSEDERKAKEGLRFGRESPGGVRRDDSAETVPRRL